MNYKTIVHHKGAAAPAAAGTKTGGRAAVVKLGLDIHANIFVVVAQHDHAMPRPPRRFAPWEFVPWVEGLLRAGHTVHVVYEACGFGFGLCRALEKAGAHCRVIAPRKLDEQRTGVKTDARDAATLCQRLSRYVDGNTRELAVIRVPTEEEEQLRHIPRQREALVRARTKMQAQGRGLLVSHGQPAPPHWWRAQTWRRLEKVLPAWLLLRLEVFRPVLETLDKQIAALSLELEAAAPADLPRGLGKLTSVALGREVCDWKRFNNRRQVASYTGLCPGEHSSGAKRVQGSVTKHGNPRLRASLVELAWRLVRFQPDYPPVKARLPLLAKGAKATGAARKKAIIAVARHLAVDLWRLHTGQCSAEKLGLKN
jgi:transposase